MEAKVKEQEKKSKELEINRDQALENFEGKTLELDEMKEGFEKEIEKLRWMSCRIQALNAMIAQLQMYF